MDEELIQRLRHRILQGVDDWQREMDGKIQRMTNEGVLAGERIEETAIREAQKTFRDALIQLGQRLSNAKNGSPKRRQLAEELIRWAQRSSDRILDALEGAEMTPEILRNEVKEFADEIRRFIEERFPTGCQPE